MNKEDHEKIDINNNSSKNIVIVGNGFDMSIGLKSSYQNFIEYIKNRKRFIEDYELYNYNRLFLRKYENFHLNWSDFESLYEETVRKINNRSRKNKETQDIFDITSINDSIKRLEEDFHEYLSAEYPRWVEQKTIQNGHSNFKKFTEEVNPFFKKMIKDENTFFINFNYTNTIKDLCESVLYDSSNLPQSKLEVTEAKERVFHIHGSLEEENILFGGGFTDSEEIDKIHYSQSLINDKLFRIKENQLLNSTRKKIISTIDLNHEDINHNLFIIGHSLQGSDFPFLSKLIQKANKVFIFYYEDDYIFKMEEILKKFGSTIAEKIVLVPFLEILMKDRLIVSSYDEYRTIDPFLTNKFPREDILSELSLSIDHFTFRNIKEFRIRPNNIEKVLCIAKKMVQNENVSSISRLYFEKTIESIDFNKLINSKDFLVVLQWVNKVIFSNTEINSDFFIQLLNRGSRLNYIKMENCTLMNGCNKSADISVCKSLNRLEIIDCSYTANLLDTQENIFSIHSYNSNNIEKLTILRNSGVLIEKDILEKSTNLLEVNISIINEENVYEEEVHLENLQILHIDYTSELVPKLTVGNKIEEIVLNGYPDNFIKLSSIMRDNKESVGFPKFRLFHLKTPDQMTSCRNIIVDVILDVFSNDTKFIVDKDIKSIKEYYLEYRNPHYQFFNSIEGLIDNAILIKLSNLFLELSNIGNQSIVEKFLEEVSTKIQTFKLIGQDIEQKAVSGSNKNNEYDPSTKSLTNKYTRIDRLLYEYATGNKSVIEEFYKTLKQENKAAIVMEVYREITNEIDHIKLNTKEDVIELKCKFLTQARDKVIKDFSEAWFVSKDELDLSAIQYVAGANSIPNISGIINSKDYESYKTKNLEANPFKYAQAMKQDWQKELDEKIVWLNYELRRIEK
ncbi:AbiH family protein [Bacillus atrophaeus]|uniref:AbiH family protein n=1 Tax=Bacillus atrophaeus TaxID=1452 RepID=UPI00227F0B5B|nr:AbiH family protein [Bacillus atrophaeus]MCY8507406.1 bacteriophage abortive infection AbiH family protein [Bacillus atrophaeus]MCY8967604.1 bacteriophage abortive infection AbiH family protein [Bacillus atrophaeus]